MSEATRKLRSIEAHTTSVCGVRDLAADAIEAVEAQVAEAVARVAALEEMGRLGASPNGDDRTRGDMSPRGFDSPTPAAPTPPASAAIPASELRHRATQGFVSSTLPTDMWPHDPPSSAVPAPRGFRVGDTITTKHTSTQLTVQDVKLHIDGKRDRVYFTLPGDAFQSWAWAHECTLVHAADAPEAPAEDAGLVERLARDWDKAESIWLDWATMSADGRTTRCNVVRHILATLRAESRLCAPGEVARLRAEFYEANASAARQSRNAETLKARAEAADIRADGHAEGLRSIRKMLTKSPPDVDRAILWCDDSLSGYTQSVAATEAETNDRALAAEARAEAAEKDRDTWKSEAEQRLKTLKFEGARAEALAKDLAEARAISAATAERVRNETQIATELRKDLADARDRIASKDRSIEVMLAETRALREALDAERSGVATKLHDAGFNNVENLVGAYRFERAQADALRAKLAAAESDRDAAFSKETALRRDLLAWQDAAMEARGERDEFKRRLAAADREQERLRAELAALKAKPRFRTRKVTLDDAIRANTLCASYVASGSSAPLLDALTYLGFRRRVDGDS